MQVMLDKQSQSPPQCTSSPINFHQTGPEGWNVEALALQTEVFVTLVRCLCHSIGPNMPCWQTVNVVYDEDGGSLR